MTIDKSQMMNDLDAGWRELVAAVELVPDSEMEAPGATGEWSIKDVLGHITFWMDLAADNLVLLAEGRLDGIQVPAGAKGVQGWNERESKARKGVSLADTKRAWLMSYENARGALERVPAERLETEVSGYPQWKLFADCTYSHFPEHAEEIKAWQDSLEGAAR